jgi:hypothetical protein
LIKTNEMIDQYDKLSQDELNLINLQAQ